MNHSCSRFAALVLVASATTAWAGEMPQQATPSKTRILIDADTIWLDEPPHGFIANLYGPPQSRRSFGKTPLRIAGRSFERGLGTHAPARL